MDPSADRSESRRERRQREIDVLSVGELLVDLIGRHASAGLLEERSFDRHQGGSAANLAVTLARLGNRVSLVARVGDDPLGRFLRGAVQVAGVEPLFGRPLRRRPTTVVLVSRSAGCAQFVACRGADPWILPEQIDDELLRRSTVFHTTCFALSRRPARDTILDAARRAAALGCRLSLDANYAPTLWRGRPQVAGVLAEYCRFGAWVKASRDDAQRLFGTADSATAPFRFHELGAQVVCLTQGPRGSLVSWAGGREQAARPACEAEVEDATGAGDAYWAGFLTAWLDGHGFTTCATAGQRLAAKKLGVVGPLRGSLERGTLYDRDGSGKP